MILYGIRRIQPAIEEMKETFYLTTAIHYANAAPHIGHAYEDVLADIIARYKRSRGFDVYFLTGTDEHGSNILRKAKEEGIGPQALVDKNKALFQDLFDKLSVSYDDFIRTSDKNKHWPGAVALWEALQAKGDIYKKKYSGLYCVGCEEFKTEKDLVLGKCPEHDRVPEIIEEENYFFRASKYSSEILNKIESGEIKITPDFRKSEIVSFLKEGFEDVSLSRAEGDIPWGIPVPGDASQTMYVWCDALTNYISALGYGRDRELFEKYWPANMHIVGKGIFRFHAALWPAMLLSAGIQLPKEIFVHGYITSGGKKMSKTIGNVVDPKEIVDKYGAEAFRYFMAREISPFEDGDFTEEKFVTAYNANLANGLGNLVSRVLKMSETYFGGIVKGTNPENVPIKEHIGMLEGEEQIDGFSLPYIIQEKRIPRYQEWMDKYEIQRGSDVVWRLIQELDGYVSSYEPFKLVKTDKSKTEDILWNLLYGLYYVGKMIEPILPDTSTKISALLGASIGQNGEPVSFSTKSLENPLFIRIGE